MIIRLTTTWGATFDYRYGVSKTSNCQLQVYQNFTSSSLLKHNLKGLNICQDLITIQWHCGCEKTHTHTSTHIKCWVVSVWGGWRICMIQYLPEALTSMSREDWNMEHLWAAFCFFWVFALCSSLIWVLFMIVSPQISLSVSALRHYKHGILKCLLCFVVNLKLSVSDGVKMRMVSDTVSSPKIAKGNLYFFFFKFIASSSFLHALSLKVHDSNQTLWLFFM